MESTVPQSVGPDAATAVSGEEVHVFFEVVLTYIQEKEKDLSPKLLANIYPVSRETIQKVLVAYTVYLDKHAPAKLGTTVRTLKRFTGLKELTIINNTYFASDWDLNGLGELTQLTKLKMHNYPDRFGHLENEVAFLTNLEELSLTYAVHVTDSGVSALTRLPRLRSLTVDITSNHRSAVSLNGVASCLMLQSISVHLKNFCEAIDFDAIASLPLLETLSVFSPTLETSQVDAITNMKTLQSLVLECNLLTHQEAKLSRLTQLTKLSYPRKKIVGLPRWIGCLHQLRYLDLTFHKVDEALLMHILPRTLVELYLSGLQSFPSQEMFYSFVRLKKLKLTYHMRRDEKTNVDGLEQLQNLEDLTIWNETRYAEPAPLPPFVHLTGLIGLNVEINDHFDFQPIAERLIRLRYLCLATSNLDDELLAMMSTMSTLEKVVLRNSWRLSIRGFSLLSRLPRLMDLNLKDCSRTTTPSGVFTVMKRFPSLKHLGMLPLRFADNWRRTQQRKEILRGDTKDATKENLPDYIFNPTRIDGCTRIFDDGYRQPKIDAAVHD